MLYSVCCLVIITSRTFILLCTPCGQWTRPICSPFPMLCGAELTVYLVLVYTNIYWSGHNFCLWCAGCPVNQTSFYTQSDALIQNCCQESHAQKTSNKVEGPLPAWLWLWSQFTIINLFRVLRQYLRVWLHVEYNWEWISQVVCPSQ